VNSAAACANTACLPGRRVPKKHPRVCVPHDVPALGAAARTLGPGSGPPFSPSPSSIC